MTGRRKPEGKISECNEVKGVALNLTHSPEKHQLREWADPFRSGAGHAEVRYRRVPTVLPGVSDSIELYNGR
jgi:hypothetical protein